MNTGGVSCFTNENSLWSFGGLCLEYNTQRLLKLTGIEDWVEISQFVEKDLRVHHAQVLFQDENETTLSGVQQQLHLWSVPTQLLPGA